jgi:hypothetical protein
MPKNHLGIEFMQSMAKNKYSQTSVHELNSFLKVVRKPKLRIFPIGINVKWINPFLDPR